MKRPSSKLHSGIDELLIAADTPAPKAKPIASPIPKILLPKKTPDPNKPLDWFEAFERHSERD